MKKNTRSVTAVISFLIVVACAGGGDSSQPVSDQSTENDKATTQKETQGSVESENTDVKKTSSDTVSIEDIVKELLNEFPQGIFFNLLAREQICLVDKAGADVIRQMEKDFLSGGSIQEQYKESFKGCNIPPPPDPGMPGGQPGSAGSKPPLGESNQPGQGSPIIL